MTLFRFDLWWRDVWLNCGFNHSPTWEDTKKNQGDFLLIHHASEWSGEGSFQITSQKLRIVRISTDMSPDSRLLMRHSYSTYRRDLVRVYT
jgi:hypothetical protein